MRLMINPQMRFAGRLATQNRVHCHWTLTLHYTDQPNMSRSF